MSNYETKEIDYIINTHTIQGKENIKFSVFISHSSRDKALTRDLKKAIEKSKADGKLHNALIAEDFIENGSNFHESIKQHLHCHAGIVIISKNALKSNWVGYECGYFDGYGIPVIIWDPRNVLSFDKLNNNFLNVYLLQHMPSVRTVEEVIDELDKISIYSNMFKHDTSKFTKGDFDKILQSNVETVIVDVMSDKLIEHKSMFERCKLSTLVVNFGMFYNKQKDNDDVCPCVSNKKLVNQACHHTGKKCAMSSSSERCDEKLPDCIILNHVIQNGKFVDHNEKGMGGEQNKNSAMLQFYVPVHKEYGTEFKFIIDAPNPTVHKEMVEICKSLNFNPTVSDTMDNLRIYLSLNQEKDQGFFRLNDGQYYNNFLCPHAAMEKR